MKNFLLILNIIFSVLIVVFILIQGRGAGLGSAWGGGGEMFQTRRGMEKIILWLTTIFIVIFLVVSLINLFVK
ncbi:preprotein translocase subunit SecG [Candidatus Roizmanbacteria bacterium CG_4_9_14_3_um_filter_33_18]|jgi:preprotein translocase subunit SecG|uniref:Protein-export membrane protein SecG n=3 Tax=Candidatus Roizmaniibacteriota TaxID=1752723 RepID=A0A2M7U8B4_9BACT|nr:MAG: preprotein translocase subunit SecG [Candidatus Roizmanbacteria bacterium CG22_combo_CG10-13_8_21_14_all_34_12]PIZ67458.1 MAG: preprotein translocase subunit SecG [Candidatus Roizmanbacteria bacterium CG_4_10_14_0_2_um_filter_33_96]PJA55282.1 MAG: preprotein translocase subunit SecG [Candidatus Roizmanbacteria bacterium CG_4_9_14_3_um_filter_33_18]